MRSVYLATVTALALSACHSESDPDATDFDFPPLVTNLGVAGGSAPSTGERMRLVAVSEAGEAQDFDGDGDTQDAVVHFVDVFTLEFFNTELATDPPSAATVVPPERTCNDTFGVFVVNEQATGRDANENGVPNERTTWVFERRTQRLRALPFLHQEVELDGELAAFLEPRFPSRLHVLDARDGSLTTLPDPGLPLLVREDRVVFLRSEVGAVDLNGDGDADDGAVLHYYDAETRAVVNTGWATHDVRAVGGWLGFLVDERGQGDLDLDGEPGAGIAFVLLDPDTREERIPHVAASAFAGLARGFVLVQEERLLGDRNGDGDAVDLVPIVYDVQRDVTIAPGIAASPDVPEADLWVGLSADHRDELVVLHVLTGEVRRLGLAGNWIGGFPGHLLAMRLESGVDLNGDGDGNDRVLFDWSEDTLTGHNVGLAIVSYNGACFRQALVTLSESSQDSDANDDGDREDLVLTVFDARSGDVHGLALGVNGNPEPLSDDSGITLATVSEPAQGVDLNGDGDLLDGVLHKVHVVQRID